MAFSTLNTFRGISGTLNTFKAPLKDVTAYEKLLIDKKPWGRYSASSWSGTTLTELGGTVSRNATTSGVVNGTSTGNGANAPVTYLTGSRIDSILWTSGSIPSIFTIFSITRYIEGGDQQRILQGTNNNWMHGHWDTFRGICNYRKFVTPYSNTGVKSDWLECGGTNSNIVNVPNNVLVDGVPIGTARGLSTADDILSINEYDQPSDFGFDQALTANEMTIVSDALMNYLATGILDTPKN
jgi:hypothetical protein